MTLYYQMTAAEQRAVDLAEAQRMRALMNAIIADAKTVTPVESGTPEGRAALENFIKKMNEQRQSKPNPLLIKVQE